VVGLAFVAGAAELIRVTPPFADSWAWGASLRNFVRNRTNNFVEVWEALDRV
jgi:hypothetical protein